jgi:hypothetical protein
MENLFLAMCSFIGIQAFRRKECNQYLSFKTSRIDSCFGIVLALFNNKYLNIKSLNKTTNIFKTFYLHLLHDPIVWLLFHNISPREMAIIN